MPLKVSEFAQQLFTWQQTCSRSLDRLATRTFDHALDSVQDWHRLLTSRTWDAWRGFDPVEAPLNSNVQMSGEHIADKHLLFVNIQGHYAMCSSDTRHMQQYTGFSRENAVEGCLIDLRQGAFRASMSCAFNRFDTYRQCNVPQRMKMAWLLKERTEEADFYELCARNRGWPIRLFTEREAAKHWLGMS